MKECLGRDVDLFLLSRGELSPMRHASMQMHLMTCPACRARLADFCQVSKLLREGFAGSGPLRPIWRQFPVFPIGLLILAGLVSTAFIVYHVETSGSGHTVGTISGGATCAAVPGAAPNVPDSQGVYRSADGRLHMPKPPAPPKKKRHLGSSMRQ